MSKTLLLADDSVVIQKLVGLSFANEDVEIVSTDNGDDAVVKAREIRPDVVLADVVMPGKSGYEVCEAIKQDPVLAHIPVLLLTGTFEAFDESRATGAGADGHITKPFEAQALVERVKTVIKNARPPAPAQAATPARTSAPVPTADDLFDEIEEGAAPPSARSALFGRPESLDVTPSLSEDDLDDALDVDLFGPPGSDVGGPSLASTLGTARSASLGSTLGSNADSGRAFDATPSTAATATVVMAERFAEAPIEDATIAMLPEAPIAAAEPMLADDLGFDDPIEVHELPLASFDLDSAFDPAPPAATTSLLEVARDDANAATSRSLERPPAVADLDEILAAPAPARSPAPPPLPRSALQPERPTAIAPERGVDLGAPSRTVSDLDFGFDVSEQAPVSQVDLLAESFSSLLDVSESQLLGDPSPTRPPAAQASTGAPHLTPPPIPAPVARPASAPADAPATPTRAPIELSPSADFDVSSSDLATAGPIFGGEPAATSTPSFSASPPAPVTPAAAFATAVNTTVNTAATSAARPPAARRTPSDLDDFRPTGALLPEADLGPVASTASAVSPASFARPASGTSAAPAVDRSTGAVNAMSPILQQQVQETLEKVAWEAFSDLSETIVKQVIERIERIAWEVIPQMAETLIREEIRQLKGEED